MAIILTLVHTKQIRKNIHKPTVQQHSKNKQYKTQLQVNLFRSMFGHIQAINYIT
jgi:hypothetical protein